jgi:hypothetical protein
MNLRVLPILVRFNFINDKWLRVIRLKEGERGRIPADYPLGQLAVGVVTIITIITTCGITTGWCVRASTLRGVTAA